MNPPINLNDVDHCGVDEVFFKKMLLKIENFGRFSHVLTWRTWKNGSEVRSSCGSLMSFANLILSRNLGEAYPMQLASASGQWIISTLKSFLPSMDSNMTFKYIYIISVGAEVNILMLFIYLFLVSNIWMLLNK